MAKNYLFVYGTLMSQTNNDFSNLLINSCNFVATAFIYATKYNIGNFPGVKLDQTKSNKTTGELYEINPDSETVILKVLDDYEGYIAKDHPDNLFHRKKTTVHSTTKTYQAWIYEFAKSTKGYTVIE